MLERSDTQGGRDLYVSFMQPDSSWSSPLNLGMQVNTFADDITPFLAADNVTLYYSTKGEPGYGDNDIFVTRRLDDTWINWSTPQNLGKRHQYCRLGRLLYHTCFGRICLLCVL